jgi:hypothetical protein
MKARVFWLALVVASVLAGCSTPERSAARAQRDAYRAQEDVTRKRLALVDQYRDCVAKAGSDEVVVEACDSYLRQAEALK